MRTSELTDLYNTATKAVQVCAPTTYGRPATLHPPKSLLPEQEQQLQDHTLPVTVWLLDQPECPAYEEFVEKHPDGTFYHSLAWRDALTQAGYGQPVYLVALSGESVVGLLPLFELNDLDGTQLVSLPATPTAGLLAQDEATTWLLANRAAQLADQRGATSVSICSYKTSDNIGVSRTESRWARLPIAALPALAAQACRLSYAVFRLLAMPLEREHLAAFSSAGIGSHNGLLALLKHGYTPMCSFALDYRENIQACAIWLVAGQHTHVLSWAPIRTNPAAAIHLLKHVAELSAASMSQTIDFPLPDNANDVFAALLRHSSAEFSQQQSLLHAI